MAGKISVRQMAYDDYSDLLGWEDVAYVAPPSREWLKYVVNDPNAHALVAEDDSAICGYCQFDIEHDLAICLIVVKQEYRRKGIARHLHRAILNALREQGTLVIRANVELANDASLRTFESFGYSRVDTEDGMVILERNVDQR